MDVSVHSRLEFLRRSQNPDGGWGYFPGKRSWLEPTVYSVLALEREGLRSPESERGWRLLRSWQLPDGAWRPAAGVAQPHWTTSLCVSLHCVRGIHDEPFRRGVSWLRTSAGAENNLLRRLANFLRPTAHSHDPSLVGWPWLPGTNSWVEPTAHALVALKNALPHTSGDPAIGDRIRLGERMLLDRRCSDGGWNYGNRMVLGETLPSYPETTALGLLGLMGRPTAELRPSLERARRHLAETRSPLARAWLIIALRGHGENFSDEALRGALQPDILLAALETLARSGAGLPWLIRKPA